MPRTRSHHQRAASHPRATSSARSDHPDSRQSVDRLGPPCRDPWARRLRGPFQLVHELVHSRFRAARRDVKASIVPRESPPKQMSPLSGEAVEAALGTLNAARNSGSGRRTGSGSAIGPCHSTSCASAGAVAPGATDTPAASTINSGSGLIVRPPGSGGSRSPRPRPAPSPRSSARNCPGQALRCPA